MNKKIIPTILFLTLFNTAHAIELISVNIDGKGNQQEFLDAFYRQDYSIDSKVTPDGRYVVFASGLLDLVPEGSGISTSEDRNHSNVFLRDREKQETIAISVPNPDTGATELDGDFSGEVSISDDGRYIVFLSDATNLVSDYPYLGNLSSVYYYDTVTQQSTLVSVSPSSPDQGGIARDPVISGDGRYITYATSTNVVPGVELSSTQIVLYDMTSKTHTIISRADGINGELDNGDEVFSRPYGPAISKDGRYVTFVSSAINLTEDGPTEFPDYNMANMFVRDTVNHTTKLVTKKAGTDGEYVDDGSGTYHLRPIPGEHYESNGRNISDDGCYIVYHSNSAQLVENDIDDDFSDVFLYDQCRDTTTKITAKGIDGKPVNGDSTLPHISGNGRYITFWSDASNLVKGDTNDDGNYQYGGFPVGDIFLYDQESKTISRVNVDENGEQAELNSISSYPSSVTNDGYVAYTSTARNLVPEAESKGSFEIYYSKPIVKDTDNQDAISSIPSSNMISLSLLMLFMSLLGLTRKKYIK